MIRGTGHIRPIECSGGLQPLGAIRREEYDIDPDKWGGGGKRESFTHSDVVKGIVVALTSQPTQHWR
jgi:hypothetical protein